MKKKKEISTKKVIIISAIGVIIVILGVSAYFIFRNSSRRDFRGGSFQPPDEATQAQITSFFESSPSPSQIEDYCKNNPMYCMYYCRTINPSGEICSQLPGRNRTQGVQG